MDEIDLFNHMNLFIRAFFCIAGKLHTFDDLAVALLLLVLDIAGMGVVHCVLICVTRV